MKCMPPDPGHIFVRIAGLSGRESLLLSKIGFCILPCQFLWLAKVCLCTGLQRQGRPEGPVLSFGDTDRHMGRDRDDGRYKMLLGGDGEPEAIHLAGGTKEGFQQAQVLGLGVLSQERG